MQTGELLIKATGQCLGTNLYASTLVTRFSRFKQTKCLKVHPICYEVPAFVHMRFFEDALHRLVNRAKFANVFKCFLAFPKIDSRGQVFMLHTVCINIGFKRILSPKRHNANGLSYVNNLDCVVLEDKFNIVDGHPTFDRTYTEPVDANEYAARLIKPVYREGYTLPELP